MSPPRNDQLRPPARALRVTFVGELGWELYCPTEYGAGLWQALVDAGAPHGLRPAGYRAIESLRLEKGYRVWGSDVTRDTTPVEAVVQLAKGADVLVESFSPGVTQRLGIAAAVENLRDLLPSRLNLGRVVKVRDEIGEAATVQG